MSPFLGGSALAYAEQVAGGFTTLSSVQLRRLSESEIDQLRFELEKILRDLRALVIPQDELAALQGRNRKISRVTGALQQIQAFRGRRGG
ncbi:MAG: hypothetical protein HRF46_06760 [Acidobacteriota bacterium]|jgi:hypothetical protein